MSECRFRWLYTSDYQPNKRTGISKDVKIPSVCICLRREEGVEAIGVAICGPYDNPNRSVGRAIAENRANFALKCDAPQLPVYRFEAARVLAEIDKKLGVFLQEYKAVPGCTGMVEELIPLLWPPQPTVKIGPPTATGTTTDEPTS